MRLQEKSSRDVQKTLDEAVRLAKVVTVAYLDLGEVLYQINHEGMYLYGRRRYASFDEFVDGELGLGISKAKQLISVYWWFVKVLGLSNGYRELLGEIGWTKTATLVGVGGTVTLDAWIEAARKHTQTELHDLARIAISRSGQRRRPRSDDYVVGKVVEGLPVPDSSEQELKRKVTVNVTPGGSALIDEAVETRARLMAMEGVERPTRGDALVEIAEDYLDQHATGPFPDDKDIRRMVIDMELVSWSLTPYGRRPEGAVLKFVQVDDSVKVRTASGDHSLARVIGFSSRSKKPIHVRFANNVDRWYSADELLEIHPYGALSN